MRANELRIGNLIAMNLADFPENYFKVMEVAETAMMVTDEWNCEISIRTGHDFYDVENMEPIPLTEEWLNQFGFNMNPDWTHEPNDGATALLDLGYFRICRNMMGGIMLEDKSGISTGVGVDYVHQLQNIYFVLTGEELKLKD